jgi:hypothetical protein
VYGFRVWATRPQCVVFKAEGIVMMGEGSREEGHRSEG